MIDAEVKVSIDLTDALKAISDGSLDGLRVAGEHVLGLSRARVPIEEGTLERSGHVSDDGASTVAVSYDTPYAVRQHEDMSLRHAAGRTSKYLELAASEAAPDIPRLVAAETRRRMT